MRSEPEGWSARVMHRDAAGLLDGVDDGRVRRWRRPPGRARPPRARRQTCTIMGSPRMSASGLPGSRVEAMRAGMRTTGSDISDGAVRAEKPPRRQKVSTRNVLIRVAKGAAKRVINRRPTVSAGSHVLWLCGGPISPRRRRSFLDGRVGSPLRVQQDRGRGARHASFRDGPEHPGREHLLQARPCRRGLRASRRRGAARRRRRGPGRRRRAAAGAAGQGRRQEGRGAA